MLGAQEHEPLGEARDRNPYGDVRLCDNVNKLNTHPWTLSRPGDACCEGQASRSGWDLKYVGQRYRGW